MDTGEIVGAVLAGAGVVVAIVIFLLQRRGHREDAEGEKEAARPKLSAAYLEGPTPAPSSSGFEFRYEVVNHGPAPARDPRAEIIDAATGELVEPNGASVMDSNGLLLAGASAEAVIVVPSLKRPMKVRLSWFAYEEVAPRTHVSRAPVPQSEEEAAAARAVYRGADGPDSQRGPSPSRGLVGERSGQAVPDGGGAHEPGER